MRTDPRSACVNAEERAGWAFLHDAVCHPLMALTNWSGWSVRLHDWTSVRAWPRIQPAEDAAVAVQSRHHGVLLVRQPAPGFYSTRHPSIDHFITVQASDAVEAVERVEAWFATLADVDIYPEGIRT